MKRTMTLLALLAMVALAAGTADAGLFGKDKAKGKRDESAPAKTWRYDRLPTMAFHKGELKAGGLGQWQIGNLALQVAPNCEFAGGDDSLQTGRTAIVMGPRAGNTIVAWRLQFVKPTDQRNRQTPATNIVWSESDPTVGEGSAPN